MTKIEIYSKKICPYCVKAKNLLDLKGADYTEYMIDSDPDLAAEMQKRNPGARTVPQIFIDGKAIGGCDDLYKLEEKGELDALLSGGSKQKTPDRKGPAAS
ncbi:MAG: glutaredoxin 3 [Micavibrio sp.]|nr:MAG: glutaredoxin 3 [Micavibrio sp.]